MISRRGQDRADLVVALLRAANPVPGSAPVREAGQASRFLLEVTERTEMVQDITETPEGAVDRRGWSRGNWLGFAAGFAIALLIAVPVFLTADRGGITPDPATDGLNRLQALAVTEVITAVNTEDLGAFRSAFADDGAVGFEHGLTMPYHEGVSGGQEIPVTDPSGFEANFRWLAALDTRVDLDGCAAESDRIVVCSATVREEALRVSFTQTWRFAFDQGGQVRLLLSEPAAPYPLPTLPNGDETLGAFEDWLAVNRPEDFGRLVDPGTPGRINGTAVPLSPDLVDDLTRLIDEYLAAS